MKTILKDYNDLVHPRLSLVNSLLSGLYFYAAEQFLRTEDCAPRVAIPVYIAADCGKTQPTKPPKWPVRTEPSQDDIRNNLFRLPTLPEVEGSAIKA